MKKSTLIKGTIVLTAAGLLTRMIGFVYRIFLSNTLGAEQLGIYQLIFPVYGICHTLYASGIQTAVSKLVAETNNSHEKNSSSRRILFCGAALSFCLALTLSVLLYFNADMVASVLLKEEACAPSLRILSFIFPFCGVTSCINGYNYGRSKSTLPACTQIVEQLVRVGTVFLAVSFSEDIAVSCELAIFGVLTGELASNLISVLSLLPGRNLSVFSGLFSVPVQLSNTLHTLVTLAAPLTLNRLLLSLLHSFEAIIIPTLLRKSGLTQSEALSSYGVLNGMALPFVYFASAITNALAVLLLPAISEQDSSHDHRRIALTVERSVSVTLLLGIFCNFLFLFFGASLGTVVFHNPQAGGYIRILSCLCPFLYLTTTLSSILNGLGKTLTTFITSLTGSVLRIALLYFLVPNSGMEGCFVALLLSQLVLCACELILVHRYTDFHLNVYRTLLLPALSASMISFLCHRAYLLFSDRHVIAELPLLLGSCSVYTFTYLFLPIRLLMQNKR